MKKPVIIVTAILCLLFLLVLPACVSRDKYNELQQQSSELQKTVSDLQAELLTTQNDLAAARSELARAQSEISRLKADLAEAESRLLDTRFKLEAAESKLSLYQDTLGITVNSGVQPGYNKALNLPIVLENNPAARNPVWQELKSFLAADKTDEKMYVPGVFMCGGFAETLHNNAEKAGIRAALVTVDFVDGSIGHALNAFKTTDRGLVYIDCTGRGLQSFLPGKENVYNSWDKIAYVSKGKEYGTLGIINNDSFDYAFYEHEKARWLEYEEQIADLNEEIDKFNAEIEGRIYYIGTPEWYRIKEWEYNLQQKIKEVEAIRNSLIDIWKSLGIVSKIEIWW
ncbi:MAG: hypothetical protein NUV31_06460 [Dehalococcoidales bacterium]|nr:hypothetical protein [Dehalococcoidales bacterium]